MSPNPTAPEARIEVRKTYKLYIGGAFPRSESGRTYEVHASDRRGASSPTPRWARARTPVTRSSPPVARSAAGRPRTAYNRGQVLYRVAELMEGRRAQFVAEVAAAEGVPARRAEALVSQAIDRWVWYAGWSDKIAQVARGPQPGRRAVLRHHRARADRCRRRPRAAAVLTPGAGLGARAGRSSAATPRWSLASETRPLPAVTLSRGARHVGRARRRGQRPHRAYRGGRAWLASHRDVNAIDLAGAAGADGDRVGRPRTAAADNLKRVFRPAGEGADAAEPDWAPTPDLSRIRAFLESKTVWHPKGR